MDCKRIAELLGSIIYLANDAHKSMNSGDTSGLLDCLDLIEGDMTRIRDETAATEAKEV